MNKIYIVLAVAILFGVAMVSNAESTDMSYKELVMGSMMNMVNAQSDPDDPDCPPPLPGDIDPCNE